MRGASSEEGGRIALTLKAGLIAEGTRKRRWQRVGWSPARQQDGDLWISAASMIQN